MPTRPTTTKAGKQSMAKLTKPVRDILKADRNQKILGIQDRFKNTLLSKGVTRAEIEQSVSIDTTSLKYDFPEMKVHIDADGTINAKALNAPLRQAYREAEQLRRAEIQTKVKERLTQSNALTPSNWEEVNEISRRLKHPFKGKFKN
jgi:hypothetical protein